MQTLLYECGTLGKQENVPMSDPVRPEGDVRQPKAQRRMPKKDAGTSYGKRKTVQTYLTPEEYRALVALAKSMGISSSALLQVAFRAYVEAFWAEILKRRAARNGASG